MVKRKKSIRKTIEGASLTAVLNKKGYKEFKYLRFSSRYGYSYDKWAKLKKVLKEL